MKLTKIAVPIVLCLLLVSTATAVLAVGKAEKLQYNFVGEISGPFGGGAMSLSFSGRIVGVPDYEYEFSDMPEWGTITESKLWATEEWTDEWGKWKRETYRDYYEEYTGICSQYSSGMWEGPLSTFNGKLDVSWPEDSTTTFTVQLRPYGIQKGMRAGMRDAVATETYWYVLHEWVEYDGVGFWEWRGIEYDDPIDLGSFTYSYVESWLYLDCSGKIQSKGHQPLYGTFHLQDSLWVQDGSEDRSISASGNFGPYYLWVES